MEIEQEVHNHAFLKSLTFRVAVVSVDFFILALLMGSARSGGIATLIRHGIQIFMYWYHERVWERSHWGIVNGVESGKRAMAKTLTYRAFATGQDLFVIFFLAGSLRKGVIGTVIIAVVNSVIFYMLERMWIAEERWEQSQLKQARA